jgi:hypothetical protein
LFCSVLFGERWRRHRSGDDGCGGGRRLRRMTMAMTDNNSGGRQGHAGLAGRLQRGRTRVGGKRRWRHGVAMTSAEGEDGSDGQQRQRMTPTAMADDGSGGQQRRRTTTARKIGRRTTRGKDESGRQTTAALDKRLKSPPSREREKINKSCLCKKTFFQQYGLSGWIFCSR